MAVPSPDDCAGRAASNGGRWVTFSCTPKPGSKGVYLIGDFNGWDRRACPMAWKDGSFQTTICLKPGEYTYKFLIDGEVQPDPASERRVWCGPNDVRSIITVTE